MAAQLRNHRGANVSHNVDCRGVNCELEKMGEVGSTSECARQLQKGVESVAGAARLSIAAVSDMLAGTLTPQEASVVNTATGRLLKACELHLKYARAAKKDFCLPAPEVEV